MAKVGRWETILKACSYCGRIHPHGYKCTAKPQSNYVRNEDIQTFRNSKEWRDKRIEIRERDGNMCLACWHNLSGTIRRINQDRLSVHHIKSLIKAWKLRLFNNNLITLCEHHHEEAEKGEISEQILLNLIEIGLKITPHTYPLGWRMALGHRQGGTTHKKFPI